jgi:hypothetical protein
MCKLYFSYTRRGSLVLDPGIRQAFLAGTVGQRPASSGNWPSPYPLPGLYNTPPGRGKTNPRKLNSGISWNKCPGRCLVCDRFLPQGESRFLFLQLAVLNAHIARQPAARASKPPTLSAWLTVPPAVIIMRTGTAPGTRSFSGGERSGTEAGAYRLQAQGKK